MNTIRTSNGLDPDQIPILSVLIGPNYLLFAKFISRWMTNVAAGEERVKYQGPVAQSIVSLTKPSVAYTLR